MTMHLPKPSLQLIWFALSTAVACIFSSCENTPEDVNALSKKVTEVEEGTKITAIFSQNAKLHAKLFAPTMLRSRGDTLYTEFPKSILVNFYEDSIKLQNVVKSKYAKYYETEGKVFLKDSVVVYNMKGDTLLAKTMWWDQNLGIFYSTDSVRVISLTQQYVGSGIWAKSDFSKYSIQNAKGVLDLPEQMKVINPQ